MQNQVTKTMPTEAEQNLTKAINRLETAVSKRLAKFSETDEVCKQVIKELDTYIGHLETLLNTNKK